MSETVDGVITEARGVFAELSKHGYNVVSVNRMADIIDRIEAAAQICGEIGEMLGREAAKNQSVTNCNRLGNSAKDAEIVNLRALVKEMADELSKFHAWEETRAIVAKAREVK